MEDIKSYVIRQFRPSCLVFSSEAAQAVCKDNSLTPAELLRPFGDLRNDQVTVSTSEKSGHLLKDFVVDFYDVVDYELVLPHDQVNERLVVLRKHAPELLTQVQFNLNNRNQYTQ